MSNPGSRRFRAFNRLQHFLAGFNIEFSGDALLKRGQHQIGEQQEGLFLLYDFDNVGLLPAIPLPDRLIARLAELDADGVGLLGFDDLLHQVHAFTRYVRGADQNDFLALAGQGLNHFIGRCHIDDGVAFWFGFFSSARYTRYGQTAKIVYLADFRKTNPPWVGVFSQKAV